MRASRKQFPNIAGNNCCMFYASQVLGQELGQELNLHGILPPHPAICWLIGVFIFHRESVKIFNPFVPKNIRKL